MKREIKEIYNLWRRGYGSTWNWERGCRNMNTEFIYEIFKNLKTKFQIQVIHYYSEKLYHKSCLLISVKQIKSYKLFLSWLPIFLTELIFSCMCWPFSKYVEFSGNFSLLPFLHLCLFSNDNQFKYLAEVHFLYIVLSSIIQ